MRKLTDDQRADLNYQCRQLYLYWSETQEKYTDATLFLSKKQVGMLYALIMKVVEGGILMDDEKERANQTVMYFWKARNRRIYRPEHDISKIAQK